MSNKFGYSGLNNTLNNNLGNLTTNLGFSKDELANSILVGRVIDVVLDDKNPNFKSLGEWNSLGTVEFINTSINSPNITPGSSGLFAKPLFSNIKNYPLFNEIVYIIQLPGTGVMNDGNKKQFYYFNPINVWNHPHHNAVPFFQISENKQNKNYQVTSLGSSNKTETTNNSVNLGPGFKEYSNIHPLLSYLGDYIIEGRWGNSIRFGSTVKDNIWSTSGENGNPITIIRNGQSKTSTKEGYLPIVEDINNDLSSIYLTSNQKIPIKGSSEQYNSYKNQPIKLSEYNGSQQIFSANRILLNSNLDHILLSSKKSIGLNSVESVNIDTHSFISSAKINKLGSKDTTNPMLLGNETVSAVSVICDALIKVSQALTALAELIPSSPQVGVNIAAAEAVAQLNVLKGTLNNLKSKTNFLI